MFEIVMNGTTTRHVAWADGDSGAVDCALGRWVVMGQNGGNGQHTPQPYMRLSALGSQVLPLRTRLGFREYCSSAVYEGPGTDVA